MVRIKQTLPFFLFVSLGIVPVAVQAQTGKGVQEKGNVEIVKDPLIAVLQQFRAGKGVRNSGGAPTTGNEPIDRSNMTRTTTRGFRVQIYLGSSRSEAYAEQARFRRMFRNIDTYVTYEEPNYRVKVGDFRSRSEAEQLMQGLRDQFSNVFIFTEDIFVYH